MTNERRQVFISHSSVDKGAIKPIILALIERGFPVFVDRPEDLGWGIGFCRQNNVSFLMGGDYGTQLREAVRSSGAILGCLSKNLTNDRQVWREELLIGEHLSKLVLCRIDDVSPDEFDEVDTGTVQLERLQSRGVTVPLNNAHGDVNPAIVEQLLSDAAFSFVLAEIEELCCASDTGQTAPPRPGDAPPDQSPAQDATDPFDPFAPDVDLLPEPEAPIAAPRVEITYEIEHGGAAKSLPCVIKVMADLGSENDLPDIAERNFERIFAWSFDDYLRGTRPAIRGRVKNLVFDDVELPEFAIELEISSMYDFSPEGIAAQVPALDVLLENRKDIAALLPSIEQRPDAEDMVHKILCDPDLMLAVAKTQGNFPEDDSGTELSDLGYLLQGAFKPRSEHADNIVKRGVSALCQWGLQYAGMVSDNVVYTIKELCAALDHRLALQINEILHHPEFQRLESAWRGLAFLLDHAGQGDDLKIFVMNVSKKELSAHFRQYSGPMLKKSPLYVKLYEDGYGTWGGDPPTCFVGDYYFDHSPVDREILRNLSWICDATHAPFLTGVSPVLLQMDSWEDLGKPSDLERIMKPDDYVGWRVMRDNESSRFIGLTCPRFMARPLHAHDDTNASFEFYEETGTELEQYCWANSAYVLAANLAKAHLDSGWAANIGTSEAAASIDDLPVVHLPNERGSFQIVCPTETPIRINRQREMRDLGLIPLVYQPNSTKASFFGAVSLHKPLQYVDKELQKHIDAEVQFDRFFPAARIVQYVRCILRDRAAVFTDPAQIQPRLNLWLQQYVDNSTLPADDPERAKRPLCDARVKVEQSSDYPERYLIFVSITPKYQIKGEETAVRFTFSHSV